MRKFCILSLVFITSFLDCYTQTPPLKWISSGISTPIKQFMLSPDGNTVAIIDNNSYLKILDIKSNKIINDFCLANSPSIIDFSSDSRYIFVNYSYGIGKINLLTSEVINVGPDLTANSLTGKGFSPNLDTIAISYYSSGFYSGKVSYDWFNWGIEICDFKNLTYRFYEDTSFNVYHWPYQLYTLPFKALTFSPTGQKLAAANENLFINIYQFADTNKIQFKKYISTKNDSSINNILFTPDGNTLISSHKSGKIEFWNLQTDTVHYTEQIYPYSVYLIGSRMTDNKLVVKYDYIKDSLIHFYNYDINSRIFIDSISINRYKFKSYSIDNSLKHLVYADTNGSLFYKFIQDTLNKGNQLNLDPIRAIKFGDIGKFEIVNCSGDSIIYFQNKSDGKVSKIINTAKTPIKFLKASPDGQKLLVVIGNYFQMWDIATITLLFEIQIPNYNKSDIILATCFVPNSGSFWVAVDSNIIRHYNSFNSLLIDTIIVERVYKRFIRDLAVEQTSSKLAIGSVYYDYFSNGRICYDIFDLINNKLTFERIELTTEALINAGFINSTHLLTISVSNNKLYHLYNWDLNTLLPANQYNFPKGANLNYFVYNFRILKNIPIIILDFYNGLIAFYRIYQNESFYVFNTNVQLINVSIDEERGELYAMSANGTVKCYDLSEIFHFADVKGNELSENPVNLFYPNPANNYMFLNLQEYEGNINIYSEIGQKILEIKPERIINIEKLAPGVYFIQINNKFHSFIKY